MIETDGHRAHGSRRRRDRDLDRDQHLGSAGWRVYRFMPEHVFDHPQRTVSRVTALLRQADAPR